MLSRRNIRVKVMQVLYAMSRDEKLTYNAALTRYQEGIRKSYELYLFNFLSFIKIAEYAKNAALKKQSKLRPTEEDKVFTPKIYDNPITQSVVLNANFQALVKRHKIEDKISTDNIRSLYLDFAKTEVYKNYLNNPKDDIDAHRQALLGLYKFCQSSELFNETLEDNFLSYADDKSLVVGAMKKTLKALPTENDFHEEYRPSGEATKDFGEVLLDKVSNNDKELLDLIEPTLKNWDAERVAIIDMIILKMALCELMNFPTIPTKVTLNEFVEISKLYSTDKSKDFINGILDRLLKKLHKEGKIEKEGRGLIE
ncbi:MAG: transcription antitermination factor NusB [Bacteroidetes bacterium]|jgi:N utilization substance protein B|nr:transcription antitermination factor NusB [Bacteroidota bacterium]